MTVVARFEISYRQVLNEKSELIAPLPAFAQQKNTLLELYQTMLKTRLFDKKSIALQRTGQMGTYAPVNSQEAIGTAIGHALKPEDVFVPYYRDYAAQLQRGVTMSEILAYWGGDERGSQFACQSKDFPLCVPIASQCLHATGVAFAFKHRKQPHVALACIGDGGTSEGDFYEALNVAGAWNLPVVFVINNNQWAISVPIEQQTRTETLAQKAIAAGFEGIQVDGNDMIATRDVIGQAIDKARRGEGPTLVEAITYRLSDHTTADDATRYQPQDAVEEAKHREPIARFKCFLETEHDWSEADEAALTQTLKAEIDDAVQTYLNRTPQPIESMFDYHYAEIPADLLEQRAAMMEAL
ncbi:MAG: pyruvate dehydrogenase (acetyl-transferring) E1 component subunit alpha [Gammaproteobacteria bacterium]|nr:pyruvate dehydrogenase (acetyl-transferring) E1 component subunit alpha [Gammaproteobacteria bacterium]MCH9717583.1 pyruvate dehydrogenase (acetyl-transferring) E1 component subunit alpha [Gammaproteobacteria bacterium]MCH9763514.1 pyruvate dehydrogenase (acetyl-transferring) E1 component subunit alpha [Gammaproteobacteria bacterium]